MDPYLFTSESVAKGHPDKVADQISDSVLDHCLANDPYSKVACETLVTNGLIVLSGEITTKVSLNYREIVRNTLRNIGFIHQKCGCDADTCGIIVNIHEQSSDIAQLVHDNPEGVIGAGDQGIMFGYATDETPELMPLPIQLAHRLMLKLHESNFDYLYPDAKSEVTIEYSAPGIPKRIHTIVLSAQHHADIALTQLRADLEGWAKTILPAHLIDSDTRFLINPAGPFIHGGPEADTGLTGRKIMVDSYGSYARHGGGAFSGKDPTKVDRSAAYYARYIAKNIVKAGLAKQCEVQLAYAIGLPNPLVLELNFFNTATIDPLIIKKRVRSIFTCTPREMIDSLQLRRPIYTKTAFGGHFGREEPEFTWEKTDRVEELTNG